MRTVTPTLASGEEAARRNIWLAVGAIVFAVGAAYANSLSAPFVFDDLKSITQNPAIRHLWPPGPLLDPAPGGGMSGRPLVNLSMAFNYAADGDAVWGYHVVNVSIHVLAALTLFGIVRRTLLRLKPSAGAGAGTPLACGIALLWALHPLQTEAVTYVSQRTESLMGLCYLLTLYCFGRGAELARGDPWLLLSVATCWLGMASKEVMVTAPLLVLLFDRTFFAGSFRAAWGQRRGFYIGLAASWLLLAWLMRDLTTRHVGYGLGMSAGRYALTECSVILHYLRLAVWPDPLVFDYGTMFATTPAMTAASALLMILLVAGTLFALWRRPVLGFLGAWVLVVLAPSSSVVPVVLQPAAEHRMYLPLAGLAMLVGLALRRWIGMKSLTLILVLAGALGVMTAQRNATYRSEVDLWADTVAQRPGNLRAQTNLGSALARVDRLDEAREHFVTAVRLAPDDATVRCNLANVLLELDRPGESLRQAAEAVRLAPQWVEAHCVMGGALASVGKLDEAAAQFEEALRLDPGSATARDDLRQLRAAQAAPVTR